MVCVHGSHLLVMSSNHTTALAERDKCWTSQPGTTHAVFRVLEATQANVSSVKCYFSRK